MKIMFATTGHCATLYTNTANSGGDSHEMNSNTIDTGLAATALGVV